jgi:hypothetical protein
MTHNARGLSLAGSSMVRGALHEAAFWAIASDGGKLYEMLLRKRLKASDV